jgi:predicted phage terminase large subunit-like protein
MRTARPSDDGIHPDLTQYRLLAEIQRRRECRRSFLAWCTEALAPFGQTPAAHHRLLIDELQAIVRGETRRLMINMPPGSAKSTYASVLFPAWALSQRAGLDVIGASNTAGMAEGFSRRAMGLVRDHGQTLGYGLTRETAELWETTNGGRYRAAGIGGAIAGVRCDIALIDDPTRSRADAESATVRDSQWAWFTGDLRTRLKPDASIVVIMTRWHPDDLGGRLLDRQPGLWRVVSLPAIAEADDAVGRAPGEWLWSDDGYGYSGELRKVYDEYEAAGATRDWAALYQQRPRPAEGSLFKIAMMPTVDAAPAGGVTARAWDLAATKQTGTRDPDFTAGVKLHRAPSGQFTVLDVVRLRGGPDEVEAAIVNTARQDGQSVRIGLPQDPGQAGKTQVLYLTRKLEGFMIESSPETGDKGTRAAPVASQSNVGNLSVVRAPWNAAFLDELAAFPSGTHDDQVDALSRAFAMVGMNRGPITISPELLAASRRRP